MVTMSSNTVKSTSPPTIPQVSGSNANTMASSVSDGKPSSSNSSSTNTSKGAVSNDLGSINKTSKCGVVPVAISANSNNSKKIIVENPNILFNPISKWEEPVEIPSLTLYDIHRKPRSIINDPNARIRMPLKVLNAEFHCPICLGYMKKCAIVMECLHRFCGECIQKCLRLGKKECPSCRIHIPSRRSLRPDPNFDELIRNIYGDIHSLEKAEEREIETLNKLKNMNNAYAESRKLGIMQQAIHRKKNNKGMNKLTQIAGAKRKASGPPTIQGLEESSLVDFVLRRHPQEVLVDRLKREYIRTSGEIKMIDLKQFLAKKLSYQPYTHFQILVVAGGKGVILDDSISVNDVQRDISDKEKIPIVVMHYRVHPVY